MKIVTLTLSPAFDIHCTADELVLDHENIAAVTDRDAGGKGVNISRALHAYGVANTAVIVAGEENGEAFLSTLARDGIEAVAIYTPGRIRENITVHTANGKETRLSFQGSPAPLDLMGRVAAVTDALCPAGSLLTLTGRVPDGLPLDSVKDYVRALQARGVRVVIDSRSFSLSDLIEVKPFLIKPNEEEIATYMSREIGTADEALAAARALHAEGIENVMISLGGAGAVLCCAAGEFAAAAPKITPLSTIGAGDSSIGGFLAAMANGLDAEACLQTAVAFGSAACLTRGTRPPKKEDILRLLQE
jgi:1-phosphofructokinase family hexose kinase